MKRVGFDVIGGGDVGLRLGYVLTVFRGFCSYIRRGLIDAWSAVGQRAASHPNFFCSALTCILSIVIRQAHVGLFSLGRETEQRRMWQEHVYFILSTELVSVRSPYSFGRHINAELEGVLNRQVLE